MARRAYNPGPDVEARQTARKTSMGSGGFIGKYAWWYLTEEEKAAYAVWKETSGPYGVITGNGAMPANWLLLEKGSVPGVAKEDVGVVGMGYLAAAKAKLDSGGMAAVVQKWLDTDVKRADMDAARSRISGIR